ncbi:Rne/Rng family ribonuclease [Zoogloea dura]|uniref:Ribonuclease E n=1 Tax=Zoogloea dura TaxID=2728840 RepID=A0A848G178_9RHOO|nr:Rne/Rng family ribonuclease [Zoogloea dura]NML24805.1 Rne/Rng family ribonuclease [Zoogloea dura]
MKRMLFNATQAEELRVAIVDGQKLIDLDIESAAKEQRKSNIYKAVITRIEPSLEAAFVDYGAERHGFLPFKEISRAYFQPGVEASRASIKEALKEGQELIVQVEKDERGNKGAALTTFVSLAGRYLVLMPNNPRGGGVSRRVEGDERAELRDVMDQLEVPGGMSLIARTAAIGRNAEELQWDLNYLLQLWRAIDGAAQAQEGAFLIYQEGSLVIRAIRDYFQPDIGEILIDTDDVYEQARQFMAHVMPQNVNRVKRYHDDVPLFSRFQIEHQIESAYSRQVSLPSGGAIVIDHTEALVSVDVNSGRATRGADIEETAFKTNCEAADEVARQLRLRDLGGLIVIDFIDMESQKNQREVENRLRDALRYDRARVQTGKISRFGLLELSRQRLRPALAETSYIPCPRCNGTGHIRSTESSALHILRILEEEAMKDNTGALHCQVPVDVATFLLNEKRDDIAKIEIRHKVGLVLIPNRHLETPQHEIVRLRHDQLNQEDSSVPSYRMATKPADENYTPPSANTDKPARQEAAVKGITPDQPAPVVEAKAAPAPAPVPESQPGLLARIFAFFRGEKQPEPAPVVAQPETPRRESRPRNERGRREGGRDGRGRGPREERGERTGERSESREARDGNRDNARNNSTEAPVEAREKPQRQRGERTERGERESRNGERAERGERSGGERTERAERGERNRNRNGAAPKAADAEGVVASAEQLTAAAAVAVAAPDAIAESNAAEGEASTERSRRSRRGRRGGRRNDEAGTAEGAAQGELAIGEQAEVQANSQEQAPAAETAVAAAVATQVEAPAPAALSEALATTVTEAAPAVEAVPAIAPAATQEAVANTAPAGDLIEKAMEAISHASVETPAPAIATAIEIAPAEPAAVEVAQAEAAPVETAPVLEAAAVAVAPVEVVVTAEIPATEPVVEAAVAQVEASVATVSEATAVVVEVAPVVAPAPVAPSAPIDLSAGLEASGLVLIETRRSTPQDVIAAAAPAQPLGRRRRSAPLIADEPLVQVETDQK